MFRNVKYLYLFLNITVIRCGNGYDQQRIKDNIQKSVTIENTNSDSNLYIKSVIIKGIDEEVSTNRSKIFMYGAPNEKIIVDNAYVFYTVINCKFGFWVEQKISHFINNIPSFHRDKIENYYDGDQSYELTFKEKLKIFIKDIRTPVKRFLNILKVFHETYSDSSYYTEIGIFKSLISLNIKIDLIALKNDEDLVNLNRSSSQIIKWMLVEIIELQRFLCVYCDHEISNDTKISEIFGIGEFVPFDKVHDKDINDFLSKIDSIVLGSDSSLETFSAKQIFLENITKIPENDLTAFIMYSAKEKYYSNDKATITSPLIVEIRKRMEISYDIDVICWYHDSILTAIMQLVYMYILQLEETLQEETITKILEINKKIQENLNSLPSYFIEGFNVLNNADDLRKKKHDKIRLYFDDSIRKMSYADLIFKSASAKFPVYLEEIIFRTLNHFDDIICAQKYLKHLRKESDKYYAPEYLNTNTLITSYREHDDEVVYPYDTTCHFVDNIYRFSFRAQKILKDLDSRKDSKSEIEEIKKIFNTITNYCILVYNNEIANYNFIKMVNSIATILRRHLNSEVTKETLFLFKRILNIVMSELNTYRIKYCSQTTNNKYLIFIVDKNIILEEFMYVFFNLRYLRPYEFKNLNLDDIISSMSVNHDQIDYLQKTLIEKSKVIDFYGDIIKVYWNRRLQSFKDIILDESKMILNPKNIYALYDIYNKFYIAVIYYEVKNVLEDNNYNKSKMGLEKLMTELKYEECYETFPETFTSLKKDLHTIFDFLKINDKSEALDVLKQKQYKIEEKFRNFNIVIAYNADHPSISPKIPYQKENNQLLKLLHTEIITIFKQFNNILNYIERCFKMIIF